MVEALDSSAGVHSNTKMNMADSKQLCVMPSNATFSSASRQRCDVIIAGTRASARTHLTRGLATHP